MDTDSHSVPQVPLLQFHPTAMSDYAMQTQCIQESHNKTVHCHTVSKITKIIYSFSLMQEILQVNKCMDLR